ncbi:disulfide bond formation protein B [Pseudomonas purpurea]|uniref:disulfide bond formation protein B n=1 Tax=Pseudomonas purpurea TaxID=3136737 RepID=UPI003264BE89
MSLASSRPLFFMAFIAASLALGASYYLEYAVGLVPCSLCSVQRYCLMIFTIACLVATLHGPRRRGSGFYWLLGLLSCLGGMLTASRQVLLQSDPAQQLRGCLSSQEAVFVDMPWLCVVTRAFKGMADCTEISWTLFDLSVPEWSLLFFVGMTVLAGCQLLRHLWPAVRRPASGESSHGAVVAD